MGLLLHTEPENGTSSDESQSEDLSYVFVPRTMINLSASYRLSTELVTVMKQLFILYGEYAESLHKTQAAEAIVMELNMAQNGYFTGMLLMWFTSMLLEFRMMQFAQINVSINSVLAQIGDAVTELYESQEAHDHHGIFVQFGPISL